MPWPKQTLRLANRTYSILNHLRLSPKAPAYLLFLCVCYLKHSLDQPSSPHLTRTAASHPVAPVTSTGRQQEQQRQSGNPGPDSPSRSQEKERTRLPPRNLGSKKEPGSIRVENGHNPDQRTSRTTAGATTRRASIQVEQPSEPRQRHCTLGRTDHQGNRRSRILGKSQRSDIRQPDAGKSQLRKYDGRNTSWNGIAREKETKAYGGGPILSRGGIPQSTEGETRGPKRNRWRLRRNPTSSSWRTGKPGPKRPRRRRRRRQWQLPLEEKRWHTEQVPESTKAFPPTNA